MKRIITFFIFIISCNSCFATPGTWIDIQINIQIQPLNSVFAVSNSLVWAGGDMGTVIYSNNEGVSWSNRGGGPLSVFDIAAICAIDSQTVMCAGYSPSEGITIIFRTSNGGQQWVPAFIQQSGRIEDIKMVNATSGYAYGDPVGGRWTLLRTSNGGITWDSTGMYLPEVGGNAGNHNAMFVYNSGFGPPTIWFGTANSIIYRSTNGGFNWTLANIPISGDIFCLAFANANSGFCGSNNAACGTLNGGLVWNLLSLPGSGQVNSFVYNSGFYWYSRDNEIYFSTNSGATFTLQHVSSGSTPYHHMSFAYSSTNNTLSTVGGWAITEKNIISHYKDPSIGIQQIGTEIPKSFSLEQNYPNPFNPETKIKFNIPANVSASGSNVKLVVYDAIGREIATLIDQNLKPGYYETNWNAANCSSGIYFYKLISGNFIETKKMALVK